MKRYFLYEFLYVIFYSTALSVSKLISLLFYYYNYFDIFFNIKITIISFIDKLMSIEIQKITENTQIWKRFIRHEFGTFFMFAKLFNSHITLRFCLLLTWGNWTKCNFLAFNSLILHLYIITFVHQLFFWKSGILDLKTAFTHSKMLNINSYVLTFYWAII